MASGMGAEPAFRHRPSVHRVVFWGADGYATPTSAGGGGGAPGSCPGGEGMGVWRMLGPFQCPPEGGRGGLSIAPWPLVCGRGGGR